MNNADSLENRIELFRSEYFFNEQPISLTIFKNQEKDLMYHKYFYKKLDFICKNLLNDENTITLMDKL